MYCRAVLPTAGLGNKLFPWARSRVYSIEHGIPAMAPRWAQFKIGRVVHRDRDLRMYHDLFRSSPPGYITGARNWWLRVSIRRVVEEPEDLRVPPGDRNAHAMVVFRGERDHFRQLNGWELVLLEELRTLTRRRWLRRAEAVEVAPIGIHVRRGDFAEPMCEADFTLRGAIRTPMAWFVDCLTAIRAICGTSVPAVVVSDAANRELSNLLRLDNVSRVETGSAISDLLVLCKTRFLVASGGSSFSAWAAFLGQMPVVAYPGQSLTWFQITPMLGQYIGGWDHASPVPTALAEDIRLTLQRAPEGVAD